MHRPNTPVHGKPVRVSDTWFMACDRFNAVLPVTTSITPIHLASVYLKHSKTRRGDHLWRVAAHPASGLVGFLRAQLRTAWKACAANTDFTMSARVPTCLDSCISQLLEIETFVLPKIQVHPRSIGRTSNVGAANSMRCYVRGQSVQPSVSRPAVNSIVNRWGLL